MRIFRSSNIENLRCSVFKYWESLISLDKTFNVISNSFAFLNFISNFISLSWQWRPNLYFMFYFDLVYHFFMPTMPNLYFMFYLMWICESCTLCFKSTWMSKSTWICERSPASRSHSTMYAYCVLCSLNTVLCNYVYCVNFLYYLCVMYRLLLCIVYVYFLVLKCRRMLTVNFSSWQES